MSEERLLVEARQVAFGYGGAQVISNVDLEIRAGERIAVAGPNGAGKTTLFRGLLGLIPALTGSVRCATTKIGYVPQHEQLDSVYPFTAREVVELGAVGRFEGANRFWRRLPHGERAAAEGCLDDVGLLDKADKLHADLSGGQRQRVLIARALMADPDILFLDEPTSGVDRKAARHIADLLEHWSLENGVAVVLVGHQFGALRTFAHRALWVEDGRVLDGPSSELLSPDSVDELMADERGQATWMD